MKKKISLAIVLLIMLLTTHVFAATPVTMEIVEDKTCTIKLNEESTFEKKIISSDLKNHEITLQLKVSNDSVKEVPTGELMLVIDSSDSMNESISGSTKTRKDLVLESANKLVENLLKINDKTLKIGVVSFSSTEDQTKNGSAEDSQKICDLSNNLKDLQTKISSIEGTGHRTNLDAGLQLAKSSFTSEENNKYLIVLTDGVPNLSVGINEYSCSAEDKIIENTVKTFKSFDKDVEIITLLTGISDEEATAVQSYENDEAGEPVLKTYSYKYIIDHVFGTEEKPTIGKFYYITDAEIEETITNKIYADLVPVEKILKDIKVVDYFPQYIVDNFEMKYVEGIDTTNVSSEIDKETNSITWNIKELKAGESATIQYTLKLKDEFDEKIIGEVLNTNQKVDINFKDPDGKDQTKTTDMTPTIKLTAVPVEKPQEKPKEEPKVDDTKAPEPLPNTGAPIFIGIIAGMFIATIIFAFKSRKIR